MLRQLSVALIEPHDARWLTALRGTVYDVYATPQYVLADARRFDAEAVGCLVDDDGRLFLLPLLIRPVRRDSGSSADVHDATSPYGYPGVILNDAAAATEGFADACLHACLHTLRDAGVCAVFVRLHPLLNAPLLTELRCHVVAQNGLTVSIDLEQPESLVWAAMSKGHTNAVNRARRAGYEIDILPAAQRIDELVTVYAEIMDRLGASSSYRFTAQHFERLAAMNEAFVVLARIGGVVAGAYLFFECHGIIQMHVGGARTEFMKPSPSHLLIYSVALWARSRGNKVVHLGGGVGGSGTDSLFAFKASFSPRRHAYATLRLVTDTDRYDALTRDRALQLGKTPHDLVDSGFFPAYRASG